MPQRFCARFATIFKDISTSYSNLMVVAKYGVEGTYQKIS